MGTVSRKYHVQILDALRTRHAPEPIEGQKITVHEAVRKMSFVYERLRNVVDYKDEHLIRKAAISRILKRQLLLESDAHIISDHLVRELIAARYLPNGVLPSTLIAEVAIRVKKYQLITAEQSGSEQHLAWLRGVVSVEIEELLIDATEEKALVTFLYERMADRVHIRNSVLDETERRLLVYVACYRSLVKADDEMLSFKLLRAYLPEWLRPQDWINTPRPIAERLVAIERRIRSRLQHPLSQRFSRAVKPFAASLSLLRDVVKEHKNDAEAILEKPEMLLDEIRQRAEERYRQAKKKLRRGTIRATFYLLFTKMLIALLLEVPLELAWYKEFRVIPLLVNLLFPAVLMFFVGLLISVPGQENTNRLQKGVEELLSDTPIPMKDMRAPEAPRGARRFVFPLVYMGTFLLTFGLVLSTLQTLGFTWISSLIFLFFLCVVSFFSFRLRSTTRELVVIESKQGISSSIIDFFSLPILQAGSWLSQSISRINIFLFVFDLLFEAPFKVFLGILEDWFAFLKEKKEELQ